MPRRTLIVVVTLAITLLVNPAAMRSYACDTSVVQQPLLHIEMLRFAMGSNPVPEAPPVSRAFRTDEAVHSESTATATSLGSRIAGIEGVVPPTYHGGAGHFLSPKVPFHQRP
jgi:hypothetical protein